MKLSKEKACFVISETNFDQGEKLFLSDLVLADSLSNTHFHSNLHFAKKNKKKKTRQNIHVQWKFAFCPRFNSVWIY